MASAWRLDLLTGAYVETAQAVLWLAERTPPDALVATQGHVLGAEDLYATLAVEAAVHHLDLVVDLDRPGLDRRRWPWSAARSMGCWAGQPRCVGTMRPGHGLGPAVNR
jgi:hypothetical protein